ncbi:STM4013/SEN3800 family hydrolase [Clostridium senegalense]|uniref:STM4013/SEN3800 family hydrolase n=1 Tax=Clostridium senegalense TaxID=1465809 RepID=UPI001C120A81|nr:STM4013/SEN3800 family hydrolase [Clostridium senegalense]MBU5225949.1 STM4013/SEN3800 family hydrolase [Clostridium senegalense]
MNQLNNEVPMGAIGNIDKEPEINMNEVVGTHDILFVCLDTLRYDVAKEEEKKGTTPYINKYGQWKKCHAPGNFTYPSHHAMFSGFLPSPAEPTPIMERESLFFPKNIGLGNATPKGAFAFEGSTFIEGLSKVGYHTMCIGGVAFFNKRSDIGKVLPSYFEKSYWHPSFSCHIKNSFDNQLDFIGRKVKELENNKRIFMYVNIDTIHYPNNFYLDGAKQDNKETHAAALKYVDNRIERLFDIFRERGKTFVILCSDHGTCYGEDGYEFHCVSHEIVYTVPYKHFFL